MPTPDLANIMRRAHEIASFCEGDYRARLSYGLKTAWVESRQSRMKCDARAHFRFWNATLGEDLMFCLDSGRQSGRYNVGKTVEAFLNICAGKSNTAKASPEARDYLAGEMLSGSGYGIRNGRVANICQMFDND